MLVARYHQIMPQQLRQIHNYVRISIVITQIPKVFKSGEDSDF